MDGSALTWATELSIRRKTEHRRIEPETEINSACTECLKAPGSWGRTREMPHARGTWDARLLPELDRKFWESDLRGTPTRTENSTTPGKEGPGHGIVSREGRGR